MPWWVLCVFTQGKSFVGNPVLGNKLLNRMGLHVFRLVFAHAARRVRLLTISPFVDKQFRQQYWQNGFVIIENFLPDVEFQKLNHVVRQKGKTHEVRECIQGDTLTHRVLLDEKALKTLPEINELIENSKYKGLMALVGATYKRPLFYIQRIANQAVKGKVDPQKSLHSDTFHPTMKAWYFLDDVSLDKGPFNYVPGSHRLTLKRLKWEYARSIDFDTLENVYSKRGSFRPSAQNMIQMGYGKVKAVTVKRNTLVVADTHGYHCRGATQTKASRLEIWAFCRTNPFSLIAGFGSRFLSRIENRGAKALWRYQDEKAAAKGKLSSWHIVDSGKMFGGE